MTATIIIASEFTRRREERERQRRKCEVFTGSILEALTNEPEQRVCVASEPIGETAKWLRQILAP